MNPLVPGLAIAPIDESAMFDELYLILYTNELLDILVAIPIEPKRSGKSAKNQRIYFSGYKRYSYLKVMSELDPKAPKLSKKAFDPRPITEQATEDVERRFRRKGDSESKPTARLAYRWGRIAPIVTSNAPEVLFDREQLLRLIRARAKELFVGPAAEPSDPNPNEVSPQCEGSKRLPPKSLARIESELQELLNAYWAGGSIRGALIGFTDRCGGAGRTRNAGEAKRGRRNAYSHAGKVGQDGINVTADSEHAQTIKFCHDNYVIRGTTVPAALRRMWTNFYSVAVQQPDGTMKMEWLPECERPTEGHFRYWGTLASAAEAAWRKQLPPDSFEKNFRALRGTSHDDVFAIGQRGYIDSTSTDVHFVRVTNRLERIGLAHRILPVDAMFGYIPGLYMGTDAAASMTVRLAVYNASDPSKREWLDDLGLEYIPADDFIPMSFAHLVGDNTDLRSQEVMDCLRPINTNISYVPISRSDLNPLAEAAHHSMHRLVDHKMLGTTHGRARTERRETPAVDLARHTIMDGIRESVRAIWTHNTIELDIERSLAMKIGNVPPTRVAMTRALIEKGLIHRTNISQSLARAHLLPRMAGTFTTHGVRLHRANTGDKPAFLEPLVWTSSHPLITQWQEEARRGGKRDPELFRARFIVNPFNIRRIWFVNVATGEQIELGWRTLDVRDPELPYVATLYDLEDMMKGEAAEKKTFAENRERRLGDMESYQEATKANAEAEYQRAVANSEGPLPKSRTRADRRANRDKEADSHLYGIPVAPLPAPPQAAPSGQSPKDSSSQGSPPQGPSPLPPVPAIAEERPRAAVESRPGPRAGVSLLRMAVNNALKKQS